MVKADKIIEKADQERERIQSLLPEAAEFFHGYEGKMFDRQEAIEELSSELEVDEEVANRLIAGLVADEVDPIVQVPVGSEKHIGVIDYEENGFYYSYTDWDDVEEDRKVSVCVQCVKEEEFDTEVFRVEGENPEEELRDHISKEHSVSPAEVETGATLLSGTTIAGNTAFHTGNDGPGSGLNADLLDGTHGSAFARISSPGTVNELQKGYTIAEESQFDPSWASNPSITGIAADSNDCIWHADEESASIFQIEQSSGLTKVSQFDAPDSDPQGIAISSEDCIWVADRDGDRIDRLAMSQPAPPFSVVDPHDVGVDSNGCVWISQDESNPFIAKYDKNNNLEQSFAAPDSNVGGLGVDSNNCLWFGAASYLYKINPGSANPTDPERKINASLDVPIGLAVDRSGGTNDTCLWVSASEVSKLYRTNRNASIIETIFLDQDFNKGLGIDSSGCLWIANTDFQEDSIYKINQQSDSAIEGFEARGGFPMGLGMNPNTDCIWHTDADKDSLYKLDQSGQELPVEIEYDSPGAEPHGTAFDDNGSLWHADSLDDCIYKLKKGTVQKGFSAESAFPEGVGVDTSTGCIWHAELATECIFRYDPSGNIDQSFGTPSSAPRGLSVDSGGCLWLADNAENCIYKLQQDSTTINPAVESQFSSPGGNPLGLGVDHTTGCLWNTDDDDSVYRLDQSGNVDQSFAAPSAVRGLEVDSNGCIWVVGNLHDSVYRLNKSGAVVEKFDRSPTSNGLGVDSDDSLWISDDEVGQMSIYKIAPLGSKESFSSPASSPRGLGYDRGALWLSDENNCIFKLNKRGDVISQWTSPSDNPEGIGFTSDDCLWHADHDGSIYKLFPSATVFRNL